MYSGTRSKVVTPDGDTEEFEITAGVLQGDTLAPFIFVIVLDCVLRKAISGRESEFGFMLTPRRSSRNPEKVITDLVFADDIALTSGNVDRAQRLLSRVENEGNRVGLLLSEKKTKVMTCNVAPDPILTNGGIALEEVEDFNISVHGLTLQNETSKHVRHSPGKRWIARRGFGNPMYPMNWRPGSL